MGLTPPYILLDDARPGGAGTRLYHGKAQIFRAETPDAMPAAMQALRQAHQSGAHLAGYINYEAASGIDAKAVTCASDSPCLWFAAFEHCDKDVDIHGLLPDPAGAWVGPAVPAISQAQYDAQLSRVLDYIAAGDIYQANLTFRAHCAVSGNPAAIYALLRQRARAGYGALIGTGDQWIISLSPELFFECDADGNFVARPMKGTARRGATPDDDTALAEYLASDPKQRAENLMIVDLMRNDLSRIAEPGSVRVPSLFHVEQYPTVHQMVSTIVAKPRPGVTALDGVEALFPCGSVTGAPKLRAMEIITEVEGVARGVYTGGIGHIDPDGRAAFNVAIRTLTLTPGSDRALLGLGSGVVADSEHGSEWQECLDKGAFLTAGEVPFDLIETMRFDPHEGIPLLERHLSRMKASARHFGFEFDRHAARNELQAATFRLDAPARIRVLLSAGGALSIGIAPLPGSVDGPVTVAFAPLPVASDDFRLAHKTSRRNFYTRVADAYETIYVDPDGFLTEGSFTSLFVPRGDMLVTPPRTRGLLPGVLRAELLDSGKAIEADLRPEDLKSGFFIGNALRGLVSAVTIAHPASAKL